MNHVELSQVNFGLILRGDNQANNYAPEWFFGAYADAVEYMKKHPEWCKEDLYKNSLISPSFIQDAEHVTSSLNGEGEANNWPDILRGKYEDEKLRDLLERTARNIKRGKPVEYSQLFGHIQARMDNEATGLTKAEDVDIKDYDPFIKSGYAPFDNILGGIPADGPIVIYGLTGVGKSHFAANLISHFLHEHKKKTGAVYTLEMSAEHWKWRETKMYRHLKEIMDRLYISGSVGTIEQLTAEVSTKRLDFVVIDDLDGLARENSASEFERLYKRVKEICRFQKIPLVVLAQPNRVAKLNSKFLGRYDIAWSGAAENSAAMLIALQRANELDLSYGKDEEPKFALYDEDHEYIICYKSRDGWPADYPDRHPNGQRGPGAIILKTDGKVLWEGKPLGIGNGKMWGEYSTRSLGKKKKRG